MMLDFAFICDRVTTDGRNMTATDVGIRKVKLPRRATTHHLCSVVTRFTASGDFEGQNRIRMILGDSRSNTAVDDHDGISWSDVAAEPVEHLESTEKSILAIGEFDFDGIPNFGPVVISLYVDDDLVKRMELEIVESSE